MDTTTLAGLFVSCIHSLVRFCSFVSASKLSIKKSISISVCVCVANAIMYDHPNNCVFNCGQSSQDRQQKGGGWGPLGWTDEWMASFCSLLLFIIEDACPLLCVSFFSFCPVQQIRRMANTSCMFAIVYFGAHRVCNNSTQVCAVCAVCHKGSNRVDSIKVELIISCGVNSGSD